MQSKPIIACFAMFCDSVINVSRNVENVIMNIKMFLKVYCYAFTMTVQFIRGFLIHCEYQMLWKKARISYTQLKHLYFRFEILVRYSTMIDWNNDIFLCMYFRSNLTYTTQKSRNPNSRFVFETWRCSSRSPTRRRPSSRSRSSIWLKTSR